MNVMPSRMSAMFGMVFVIVIGIILFSIVKGLATWNRNNHAPRLTVKSKVVAKRMAVSQQHHANGGDASGASGYHTTSQTNYFSTFEFESGDRMEFSVESSEYAQMAEGDQGQLSFQGTRYLGFERTRN